MQRGRAALGFALVMAILPVDAAALRPLATQHITPFRATRACARMGWAEAKKKREEEERIRFEEMEELRAREAEKREAAAKLEREQAAEKRRKELARIQEYQDNVDFDRPGGVLRKAPTTLTKRDLENAQVMSSPVIDAEAKLQEATAKAGTLGSQDAAIALLREVLAAADAARVPG